MFSAFSPTHKLVAAGVTVAPDDGPGVFPIQTHDLNQAGKHSREVGGFVAAAFPQQWKDHLTDDAFEDQQRHVVVVIIEEVFYIR